MVDAAELQTTLDASSTAELTDEAAKLIAANHAAAPVGAWSGAPSMAASTVAMTNTTAWPIEVSITGGTWTVFKKNNVTLTGVTSAIMGTIPFRFTLRPGGTWALTYSVAPTGVQWDYA